VKVSRPADRHALPRGADVVAENLREHDRADALGRHGVPEDVVGAALFLASDA